MDLEKNDETNEDVELKKIIRKKQRYQVLVTTQILILICVITIGGLLFYSNEIKDECDENKNNNNHIDIKLNYGERAIFNEPFEQYTGIQSGTFVRELISKINQHNKEYAEDDPIYQIRINNRYDDTATDEEQLVGELTGDTSISTQLCGMFSSNNIKSIKKYRVLPNFYNNNRNSIICNIDIKRLN